MNITELRKKLTDGTYKEAYDIINYSSYIRSLENGFVFAYDGIEVNTEERFISDGYDKISLDGITCIVLDYIISVDFGQHYIGMND